MRARHSAGPSIRSSVRLRRASLRDQPFVLHVCTMVRLQTFTGPALPAEEVQALVGMQVKAAERKQSLAYPMAASYVVVDGQRPVGRLMLDAAPDRIHLVDLTLLPDAQGMRIGTTVMLGLCQLATERALPVTAQVRRDDRLETFLRHLDFEVVEVDDELARLEWRPPAQVGSDALAVGLGAAQPHPA